MLTSQAAARTAPLVPEVLDDLARMLVADPYKFVVEVAMEELGALMEDLERLIVRYVDKRPIGDVSTRPRGSRAVDLTLIVVPQDLTAAEQ